MDHLKNPSTYLADILHIIRHSINSECVHTALWYMQYQVKVVYNTATIFHTTVSEQYDGRRCELTLTHTRTHTCEDTKLQCAPIQL